MILLAPNLSEVQDFYDSVGQYLSQGHIFLDILRTMGWLLVKLLKLICDTGEDLLNTVYGLTDFVFTEDVQLFIKSFKPAYWILFAFALIILGWHLIFNRGEKKPKVIENILILVMVLTIMPQMIVKIMDVTQEAVEVTRDKDAKISDIVIRDSMADLRYLDVHNFKKDDGVISESINVDNINVNDRVYCTDDTVKHPNSFRWCLTLDPYGKAQVQEIEFGKITNPLKDDTFYRYHIGFLDIFLSLIASILVLVFTSYKVFRIIVELAINQFVAVLIASADIENGQRIKKLIKHMASMFLILFLSAVLLKFYLIGNAYLQIKVSNTFLRAVLLVFLALTIMDGPNIVQQILGIDAGLNSEFKTFAAMFGVTQGLNSIRKSISNAMHGKTAQNAKEYGGRAIGGLTGAAAGKIHNHNQNKSKNKSKNQSENNNKQGTEKSQNGVQGYSPKGDNRIHSNNQQNNGSRSNSTNTANSTVGAKADNSNVNSSADNSSVHDNSANSQADKSALNDNGVNSKADKSALNDNGVNGRADKSALNDNGVNSKADKSALNDNGVNGRADKSALNDNSANSQADKSALNDNGVNGKADKSALNDNGVNGKADKSALNDNGVNSKADKSALNDNGVNGQDNATDSKKGQSDGFAQQEYAKEKAQVNNSNGEFDNTQGENDTTEQKDKEKANLNSTQDINGKQPDIHPERYQNLTINNNLNNEQEKKGFFHGLKKGYKSGRNYVNKKK